MAMGMRINLLSWLPPLKTLMIASLVGTAMTLGGVISVHFMLEADAEQTENSRLKGEIRDLVSRLAEIEGVLQSVNAQRQAVDDISLATLGAVIDTAALDGEQNGRLYSALRVHQEDDSAAVRAMRMGPPAAAASYAALVERMTILRDSAKKVALSLASTGKDLGYRRDILAAIPSRLPASGWISSEFGVRKSPFHATVGMHYGLDIAADEGTPVYAPADGVITFAGVYGSYGKLIKMDHDFGISTRYAHNAQILVKRGQKVHRGDKVAVIGSTGRSTGPHVHYEILLHGQPVDPQRFVLERTVGKALVATAGATPRRLGKGGDAEELSEGADASETGEAGDHSEQTGLMAIAADPDLEPNANQHGLFPWLRGERLHGASHLPGRLTVVTTVDLYLTAAGLMFLALLAALIRVPGTERRYHPRRLRVTSRAVAETTIFESSHFAWPWLSLATDTDNDNSDDSGDSGDSGSDSYGRSDDE